MCMEIQQHNVSDPQSFEYIPEMAMSFANGHQLNRGIDAFAKVKSTPPDEAGEAQINCIGAPMPCPWFRSSCQCPFWCRTRLTSSTMPFSVHDRAMDWHHWRCTLPSYTGRFRTRNITGIYLTLPQSRQPQHYKTPLFPVVPYTESYTTFRQAGREWYWGPMHIRTQTSHFLLNDRGPPQSRLDEERNPGGQSQHPRNLICHQRGVSFWTSFP